MSHFCVYVFSKGEKDIEELLAPYNENIEVAPYIKYTREEAIKKSRDDIERYKNTTYAEYLKDPDEYKRKNRITDPDNAHINYLENEFPKRLNWTDEECYQDEASWFTEDMIDENGNLLSTYNPNSKWDYWGIGGRWSDILTTKEGRVTDEDYVSEIDWDKTAIPYAVITPNGMWHGRGEMGWWGMSFNEVDNWEIRFREIVDSLDDDTYVTVVDCHI